MRPPVKNSLFTAFTCPKNLYRLFLSFWVSGLFSEVLFGWSDALISGAFGDSNDHFRYDLRHRFAVCTDSDRLDRDDRDSPSPQLVVYYCSASASVPRHVPNMH